MARKRESGVTLPEGVEKTSVRKPNGKVYTYYYWNPGRGTDREGERIKLPNADTQPVAGGLPVLEDPHLDGPELDGLAAVRRDHGDLRHRSLLDES